MIYLREMVAPALFGIILCVVLYFTSLLPISIPFVAMVVKGMVGVTFSVFYVQLLGYYDVLTFLLKGLKKVHILK